MTIVISNEYNKSNHENKVLTKRFVNCKFEKLYGIAYSNITIHLQISIMVAVFFLNLNLVGKNLTLFLV